MALLCTSVPRTLLQMPISKPIRQRRTMIIICAKPKPDKGKPPQTNGGGLRVKDRSTREGKTSLSGLARSLEEVKISKGKGDDQDSHTASVESDGESS
uniref:Uncharacterized protein n=1 Tax=Nelumbo nucifera TaxID=4432 RepID=A0A822YGQ3_NELNU|nr:TPA_asm: hypothetical protein HUJ06_031594 [Nelumbo nucifera]